MTDYLIITMERNGEITTADPYYKSIIIEQFRLDVEKASSELDVIGRAHIDHLVICQYYSMIRCVEMEELIIMQCMIHASMELWN